MKVLKCCLWKKACTVPNVDHNFETLHFDPLNLGTLSLEKNTNSDKSYFGDYLNNLKTEYVFQDKFISHLKTINKSHFSIMHHNIRSINKHSDKFKRFLSHLMFLIKVTCSCQTWITGHSNINIGLRNYILMTLNHQKNRKGRAACIFVHDFVSFPIKGDLEISHDTAKF